MKAFFTKQTEVGTGEVKPLSADERLLKQAVARCLKAQVAEVHGRLVGGMEVKGGPGSGNFGHEGRPGEVGGSGPGGGGSRSVSPGSVRSLQDLRTIAQMGSLPKDDDKYEYFYHAFRYRGDADTLLQGGKEGKTWLSKDEIRDRGAGYAVVRVPKGEAVEGRDFVEPGLTYREWIVDKIPASNIVSIVRDVPVGSGGHGIRENKLAAWAIDHQGEDTSDLPEAYRGWFNIKEAKSLKSRSPTSAVPSSTKPWDDMVMREVRPIWFGLFKKGGDKALQNIRRFPKHARKMAVLSWAEMQASERVEVVVKGGPGSGNFGHEGRPGLVGGSGPGGGGGGEESRATVIFSKEGKTYYENILREIRAGRESSIEGSRSMEAVIAEGAIIGTPEYAPVTPHHQRHEGGAWTYEPTYSPVAEAQYQTFFHGPASGITLKDEHIRLYPDRAEIIIGDNVVALPASGILLETTGVDLWEDRNSPIEFFGATITRTDDPSDISTVTRQEWDQWANDYFGEDKKSFKAVSGTPSIVIPEWIEDPDVLDALEREMFKFAHGINQTTADDLREELMAGMEKGETIDQLADRISGLSDEWVEGWRSEMIARTETARAFSTGHIEAWRSTGVVDRKVWVAAGDACPFCQQMDGTAVELDENFFDQGDEQDTDWKGEKIVMEHDYSDVNGPPLHPNCYLHHTVMVTTDAGKRMISKIKVGDRVLTARGRFRPVTRVLEKAGHYKGRAVRIMYKGWKDWGFTNRNSVTVTPEHPFLTDSGWKVAQDITPNDSLYVLATYCPSCGKKIPFWRKYCSDECVFVDQPEIGEKISKVKKQRNWMKGRTGALHHGWRGGKIWWRGKEWDVLKRKIVERDGFVCQDCGMTEEACLEKSGQPLHVHHLNPYRDSFDNSPQNLITLCVSCHAKREGTVNSRFLKRGGVSFIDTPVLAVQHIDNFKGERLYNFSVAEDESYIAQGIVNHNCRCVLVAELDEEKMVRKNMKVTNNGEQ